MSPASRYYLYLAVVTDDDFVELDRIDIRCRLLPYVVPAPMALLVTKVSPDKELRNQNLKGPCKTEPERVDPTSGLLSAADGEPHVPWFAAPGATAQNPPRAITTHRTAGLHR
jgi:hypothetical protein